MTLITLLRWLLVFGAFGFATHVVARVPMDAELRTSVDSLKQNLTMMPTASNNAQQRARILYDWINAHAMVGGYVPVNATLVVQRVLAYQAPMYAQLDALIKELALYDDDPQAIGPLTLTGRGSYQVNSYSQFSQTYTVGTKPLRPGGGLLVSRHFQTNPGFFQTEHPDQDNYVSIRSSNSRVRFKVEQHPVSGMHGGFRTSEPQLVFRLRGATLQQGATITVTYGDRSGGSRGLHMPDFASEHMPFPLYLDLDGSNLWYSLPIQPLQVVGATVVGVHGFAPSLVAAGEAFSFSVRAEDAFANRATGSLPGWELRVNGQVLISLPAGGEAVQVVEGVAFDHPGVYRITITSTDGAIQGVVNPIVVEKNPQQRVYWGDTHGHSGFAEGIGTADEFMRFARDDSRLDFVTHSEHDVFMDAREWEILKTLVRKYHENGRFIPYLGYEWSIRNPQGGHHNVLFRTPEGRATVPGALFPTLSRLYQGLREANDPRDIVVIPHAHNTGDYRQSDPELELLVEILSMHGNFEWFGHMYLKHGHQVGFVAASDDHLARPGYSIPWRDSLAQQGGLAGVWATGRTNDEIFDAMRGLSTYATSGDRMVLNFAVNDGLMGQRIPFTPARSVKGRVVGTAPIRSITVLKNDTVLWSKNYDRPIDGNGEAETDGADTHLALSFSSESHPGEVSDNPRGWRHWRGTLEVQGAEVVAATLVDEHNRNTQNLERDERVANRLHFATHSRGDHSSIALTLRNADPEARLVLNLEAATETGSAPPFLRAHQTIPGSEVTLRLSDLRSDHLLHPMPIDGFADAVELTRTIPEAPLNVEFQFEDDTLPGHDDYYFMRVRQANEALGWSSPVWVGGHPTR